MIQRKTRREGADRTMPPQSLTVEERAVYEEKAEVDRKQYALAKEEYEKNGGSTRFKFVSDPPRPPTAYFIFLGKFREEYKAKHPEMKGIVGMSKEASRKWRGLSPERMNEYKALAEKAKDEYCVLKAMTMEGRKEYLKDVVDPYAKYFLEIT